MSSHIPPLTKPYNDKNFCSRDFIHPRYWLTWFLFALLRLLSCLPYRCQLWMGKKLGRLIQCLPKCRQSVVETNLQLCFPDKPSEERERIKNECYENIGIAIFEMGMSWWWSEKRLQPLVEIHGLENLKTVIARGQGAILLSGHVTSMEIGARLFTMSSPMQVIFRTQKNTLLDQFLYYKRCQYLTDVIPRRNGRQFIKGIKNLTPSAYSPDQNFTNEPGIFAPFMGVQTATITASYRLARLARCAMLPFYIQRNVDGSGYRLSIEPPIDNFPSDDDIADATAINSAIERFVRLHPEQYFWVHRRFKNRPNGELPIYL
jgi:KDO2-lipid IV(A) lauroyltransferase